MGKRIPVVAALVTATGLIAAGCGGGSGGGSADTANAKQTMTRFLSAVAAGDGPTACSLVTTSGQVKLGATAVGSCSQSIALLSAKMSPELKKALQSAQVNKVTINGTKATIQNADVTSTQGDLSSFLKPGRPPSVLTKQSNGTWKISG
jgi:phage-related minor tail protein